jgi:riboflavin kinase/FMN adenylyltransferase
MPLPEKIEIHPADGRSALEGLGPGTVLTIGNFDGVHIGHQAILAAAADLARARRTCLVAMTFEPHPHALLHPQSRPEVLTPLPFKLHLMGLCEVNKVIVLRSAHELLTLGPEAFLEQIVASRIRPCAVVEGEDFRFGAHRRGDINTLVTFGNRFGIEVMEVNAKQLALSSSKTIRVSSTLIRQMLHLGQVADAASALGRPYRLYGRIVPGRGKGRQLGFPTLNLFRPDQVLPADGAYAGRVLLAQDQDDLFVGHPALPAVVSIGRAITFGPDNPLLVEAHILEGLDKQAKTQWMAIDLLQFIRPQQRFESQAALAKQIGQDCIAARSILGLRN